MKYKTIVADPPWKYANSGAVKVGVDRHYKTMHVEEICSLIPRSLIGFIRSSKGIHQLQG